MGVRSGKSVPYWDFDPDTLQETHPGDEQSSEECAAPGMPKTMSVREMAKLLGIKKTDSYWLLHKDFFKTYVINNTTRIDVRDFERWYASQIKYHKVDGSPPGEELRKSSYSAKDIGGLLGLSEAFAYELIAKESLETITVDGWKRVPRDVFERWYASQSRYRTPEDRERDREVEENSIWLPDLARMLGISRNAVYALVKGKNVAGVFEIIVVAERKRVTKDSFYRWYEGQTRYKLLTEEEMAAANEAKEKALSEKRQAQLSAKAKGKILRKPKNPGYYTMEEITEFYGFARSTVRYWLKTGSIPGIMVGKSWRIPKNEFDDWLDHRNC